jgi:hypothetical protein
MFSIDFILLYFNKDKAIDIYCIDNYLIKWQLGYQQNENYNGHYMHLPS